MLVLALFAALIGPYFIDWTTYREDFEREASRVLGQPVQVRGGADARFVPFPSVTFENVVVGEGLDGQPMMTIDRFSMDAELAPFLSGEIRIFDMRVENPKATVRLSSGGELDWALRSEKTLPGQALVLENIGVVNGEVTVLDEQSDREHKLEGLSMTMSAKSLTGPWSIDGVVHVDGVRTTFELRSGALLPNGGIRLRSKLLPVGIPFSIETEGDLRIEDLKPRYSGNFTLQAIAPPKTTDGTVRDRRPFYAKARGVFDVDNERLRIDDYRMEAGSPKDPYVVSGEATFDAGVDPEFVLIADGQQLNFARFDGDEEDEQSDIIARSFEHRLSWLRSLLAWAPVPQMPGEVRVALPAIVAGDTIVRDVVINAQPDGGAWRIDRVQANLPGRTLFVADGQLGVGSDFTFTGKMKIDSTQPSGFAAWLTDEIDPAIRRLDRAAIEADVDLSARLQRFDQMKITIGSDLLEGQFQRAVPVQGRPALGVELDGEDVDLDAIRAFARLVIGDGEGNRLAGHDIDARMRAERLEAFGVPAEGADVSLRLKGGTLDIDRFTITDIAGASIASTGQVRNVFSAPEGNVDIELAAEKSEAVIALLSRLFGGHPVLDHLEANSELFNDARIDLRARFDNRADAASTLVADADGEIGASKFDLELRRNDVLAPLSSGQLSVVADIHNSSPRLLLGQLGIAALASDLPGPASAEVRIEGAPAEDLAFSFGYQASDVSMQASGKTWQDIDRRLQADFDLSLESSDLTPYLLSHGIVLTATEAPLPVQVSANVGTEGDSVHLTGVEGSTGGTRFAGDLTLNRGSNVLGAKGSVAVSGMDLGWMAEMMLGFNTLLTGEPGWSDQEFLPPLQSGLTLDVDVTADVADLHFGPAATEWSGQLVLNDDELQWRDISAAWLDGMVSGQVRLANRQGSGFLSGQLQLENAQLAPLVWQHDGFPVATGTMDVTASFEGTGKSLRAVVASLTGSGIVGLAALDLRGLENEALEDVLTAADREDFDIDGGAVQALAEQIVSNGSFFAGETTTPFTIAAGTVRLPNIVLSDTGAALRGEARLDIADQAVDARFDLEFDASAEALTGAAPSVNLTFLGPLSDPGRLIDAAELSNYLSLRAYERERRRVETMQAEVLENQRLRREVGLSRERARLRRERLRSEENELQIEEDAALQIRPIGPDLPASMDDDALLAPLQDRSGTLAEQHERAARIAAERLARNGGRPFLDNGSLIGTGGAIELSGERLRGDGGSIERRTLPPLNFDTVDDDSTGLTQ